VLVWRLRCQRGRRQAARSAGGAVGPRRRALSLLAGRRALPDRRLRTYQGGGQRRR